MPGPAATVLRARAGAPRRRAARTGVRRRPRESRRGACPRRTALGRLCERAAAAAVLGESFGTSELEVVSGRSDEILERTLDDAAAAGLIEDLGAGRHRFAHALTRDAVYAGLGASRRARLHRAAADALATRYGLDTGAATRRDRVAPVRRRRGRKRRRGGGRARGARSRLGPRAGRLTSRR